MKKITYAQVGDDYMTKDPIKKLALSAARQTAANLKKHGFEEVSESRGESAFVWKQGETYMASMVEGLGTKNLVADETRKITGKTYYDVIGNDTIAYIVNDLITVGAKPLVIHAYWAIEDNSWLLDRKRTADLIKGWRQACNLAGATWGGGETGTLKQIIIKDTVDLAGSAVGIIGSKQRFINGKKLKAGDRIIFIKSNGINASGISLARVVAKKLPNGYGTKLPSGQTYGEAILTKCNIYSKVIQNLLDGYIDVHYVNYISGHGLRKVMRADYDFTYVVEKLFPAQEIFRFIQKKAGLSDSDVYDTYNMGQDYVIFVPQQDVERTLAIIKKNGFEGLDAGYVEKGPRQVVIKPKNIIFKGETLDLR